ncbi:MAG: prepilin-type N-terminal cleavage/methylation domain-containing protein, partial [Phycisphaeraceae bacterium]
MRHAGFTFMEVLAVVALLAVLSGGVMWAMAGDVSRASKQDAIQKLTHADRTARLAASRLGSEFTLRIDLDRQRMWREPRTDANHPRSTPVTLTSGYRI